MKHINTKLKTILLSTSILTSLSATAGLKITEVMPSNLSTIMCDAYDYYGYVEFYNDGGQTDLQGWTVTNLKEGKVDWEIKLEKSHQIPSGYSLLFFGKKETDSNQARNMDQKFVGCVAQKLTPDAGKIIFSNGGQKIEMEYAKQYPHISYCEQGYMIPTPGAENSAAYKIEDRAKDPTFGGTKPGVVRSGNASVQLSASDGSKIYYTLDGSIPTKENGQQYSGQAIQLDKTTIVRARAYKDGGLYSNVVTGSYLFTSDIYTSCGTSDLPIVSICSDQKHFTDNMIGICVKGSNGVQPVCSSDYGTANYAQDWMRPANFEYIIDGQVVDCQEVEVGVFGVCSRQRETKSFKIKANKRTGSNKFQYTKFFPCRTYTKYKAIAIRNGGNGWYKPPRWRDGYMQQLTHGCMDVDYQAYQPVAYFLNGEYRGLMGLRERTDEDYIESNYGLKEDEIEYIRIEKNPDRYEAQIGTMDRYNEMEQFAQNHNQDEDFYDKLAEYMDIEEYMDYQILQQWVVNTDWVNNNTKLWRKKDGGKFRWILFDTDFGMSDESSVSVNTNMLLYATTGSTSGNTGGNTGGGNTTFPGMGGGWGGFGNGPGNADASFAVLFGSCMKNEDFKYRFLDRYTYLLETDLSTQRTAAVLDSFVRLTENEACAMINYKKDAGNSEQTGGNEGGNEGETTPTTPTTPGAGDWGGIGGGGGFPGIGGGGFDWGGSGGTSINDLGGGSQTQYDNGIEKMRSFTTQRPTVIESQLVSYYELQANKARVNVKVNFSGERTDYSFLVNKIESNNKEYDRNLFVTERVKIEMRVPLGYKIQSWDVNSTNINSTESSYLTKVEQGGLNVVINLVKDESFKIPKLYINEVCASNGTTTDEFGAKPDWIELYNAENYEVDIAGYIIKNETSNTSHTFPYGNIKTIVPAGERVMLWCDKDPDTGPLHLSFKLSAATEQKIALYAPVGGKEQKIDEVTYKIHERDGSYGRVTDGSNDSKIFPACSSTASNGKEIASPDKPNGSEICTYSSLDEVIAEEIIYPNPTASVWTLNVEGEYTITTAMGQVVEVGEAYAGKTIGDDYPQGIYLLHINGETKKIIKY